MAKQHLPRLSLAEQHRTARVIQEAVVLAWPYGTRPRCAKRRGYINRVTCGRVVPGTDVIRLVETAKAEDRPRDLALALPRRLLAECEALYPPDEPPPCALVAVTEDETIDSAADLASLEAVAIRTPDAYERAAELRSQQARKAERAAWALRVAAKRARGLGRAA